MFTGVLVITEILSNEFKLLATIKRTDEYLVNFIIIMHPAFPIQGKYASYLLFCKLLNSASYHNLKTEFAINLQSFVYVPCSVDVLFPSIQEYQKRTSLVNHILDDLLTIDFLHDFFHKSFILCKGTHIKIYRQRTEVVSLCVIALDKSIIYLSQRYILSRATTAQYQ